MDYVEEDLVSLLRRRADAHGDDRATTYLVDGEVQERTFTFRQLDLRARAIGAWLQARNARGQRVMLLFPPGLEYIAAFWGCLYAGAVAVPAYPPRRQERSGRLESVLSDSQAAFVFGTGPQTEQIGKLLGSVRTKQVAPEWTAIDAISAEEAANWKPLNIGPDDLAFLQYTSGSTAAPKGVMVSHGNLMCNEGTIAKAFEHGKATSVSWLPMYHDMGLIGSILHSIYTGGHSVLMSPTSFIQRPERWLQAISRYQARTSGGPNFGYDLCVDRIGPAQRRELDLSSWSLAFNGAEPVKAATLRRFTDAFAPCGFSEKAFFPCYGLAEATLFVTGESLQAHTLQDNCKRR